jgi:hypothetical protein
MKALEQARPNLPQKPAKAAASAPAVIASKQQPTVSKAVAKTELADDDDVPDASTAVSKSTVSVAKGGKAGGKPGAGSAAASATGAKKVIS